MAEVSDQLLPENYYAVLGLYCDSSTQDIRRAYRKLAMQWHPDKWAKSPEFCGVAKRKFQQIQEAYSVLSDPKKRKLYDAGLYNPDDEEDEGFVDFLQEMASLMEKTRREDRHYSMEELQSMFWDMAKSFEFDEVSSSLQQPASWFDYQQHPQQQTCWFDYQEHPQQQTCWFDHQQHPQQQVLEYESSQWFYTQYSLDDTKRTTKRVRRDTDYVSEKLYSHTVVEP